MIRALGLALILTLSLTGCLFRKRPPAAPPGVPPPQPKSTATLKPAPPPPKIETSIPETAPPVIVNLPDMPKPPQPKPPPRRNRRAPAAAKPAAPAPAEPAAADSTVPAPPPPKLGDLLTDAQRADLAKRCDEALRTAKAALDRLQASGKTLPPAEAESMERARVFLQQAEQARERDPQTALQLAQRADVLARDLLKSLR